MWQQAGSAAVNAHEHYAFVVHLTHEEQFYAQGFSCPSPGDVAGWRIAEPPPVAHALLPGPRTLTWLLLRRPSDLDETEQALLQQLGQANSELPTTRNLVQQFMRMVRERRGRNLEAWVAQVQADGPPELRGFSRNLRRDWAAVHAGLTKRWNYGSVEGHVNRLKVISDSGTRRIELVARQRGSVDESVSALARIRSSVCCMPARRSPRRSDEP